MVWFYHNRKDKRTPYFRLPQSEVLNGFQNPFAIASNGGLTLWNIGAASIQKGKEYFLIQFPWTVLIDIGKSGAIRRGNAQMLELPFATPQTVCYLTKGMSPSQLTKKHGDKLPAAGKPAGMTFRFCCFHHIVKL
jgi:hypothetical protein